MFLWVHLRGHCGCPSWTGSCWQHILLGWAMPLCMTPHQQAMTSVPFIPSTSSLPSAVLKSVECHCTAHTYRSVQSAESFLKDETKGSYFAKCDLLLLSRTICNGGMSSLSSMRIIIFKYQFLGYLPINDCSTWQHRFCSASRWTNITSPLPSKPLFTKRFRFPLW